MKSKEINQNELKGIIERVIGSILVVVTLTGFILFVVMVCMIVGDF